MVRNHRSQTRLPVDRLMRHHGRRHTPRKSWRVAASRSSFMPSGPIAAIRRAANPVESHRRDLHAVAADEHFCGSFIHFFGKTIGVMVFHRMGFVERRIAGKERDWDSRHGHNQKRWMRRLTFLIPSNDAACRTLNVACVLLTNTTSSAWPYGFGIAPRWMTASHPHMASAISPICSRLTCR